MSPSTTDIALLTPTCLTDLSAMTSSQLTIPLSPKIDARTASSLATTLQGLPSIQAATFSERDNGTLRCIQLDFDRTVDVATHGHVGSQWKYGWFLQPVSRIILVSELSEGSWMEECDGIHTELGFANGIAFRPSANADQAGTTVQLVRGKPFLRSTHDHGITTRGSRSTGPASLCLALTAHPPIGGRGPEVWHEGQVQRVTAGGASVTIWDSDSQQEA